MKVSIHDEFDPETSAMLQAFNSRSHLWIDDRLKELGTDVEAVKEKLKTYYVGYGHKSIGDCGFTTIYIHGVSLLAAKAVEDFALYNGQESSTRYIPFDKTGYFKPADSIVTKIYIKKWLDFYQQNKNNLITYLAMIHPKEEDASEAVWEKAIRAKAFDILRGFLPCCVKTQLSWTVSLRQAYDQLLRLRFHALEEVRILGNVIHQKLKEKYPNSFTHKEDPKVLEFYRDFYYENSYNKHLDNLEHTTYYSNLNFNRLNKYEEATLKYRPKGCELPATLNAYGQLGVRGNLDFGSFRDLQRHRNGTCLMPLLKPQNGFHSWYLEQMPTAMSKEAESLIQQQFNTFEDIKAMHWLDDYALQYYLPLGTRVFFEYLAGLPQMVYIAELRSQDTVHPILRRFAFDIIDILKRCCPSLKLHIRDGAEFSLHRGTQDIIKTQ